MAYDMIIASVDAGVGTITLNRPDKMNAVNPHMFKEMVEALYGFPEQGVRAVLLRAEGRGFCTGTDLDMRGAMSGPIDAGAMLEESYHPALQKIAASPLPMVAAVQGPAAGIGVSLALTCDFVVAAKSSYFLQAFANIGLVPDGGSTWHLPRLVGRARAAELMMLAERLPAEKAAEWGMIYKAVDDDALAGEALALAQRLAAGPTRALGLIRRGIARSAEMTLSEAMHMEREHQGEAGRTSDFMEGVGAFMQKRKPQFTGN